MLKVEEEPTSAPPSFALFELGFRPFFSAAGLFAIIAVLLWMLMYIFSVQLPLSGVAQNFWHAHEMIYGYAMAVIAGFLMTAVGNWTGINSFRGFKLAAVLTLWFVARSAWFLPYQFSLPLAAVADLLFILALIVAVSLPVLKARQWSQMGIISKLWLMFIANSLFYAGAFGYLEQGIKWGIYTGLYLILALIFVMARRVIPFFIERGVDEDFVAKNYRWVDISSLVLFLVWVVLDVFMQQPAVLAWLSLCLFALHLWRLLGWHTAGIWSKPLVWSLFVGYGFIPLGFLLKALSIWQGVPASYALHIFAIGVVGLITISMMSRVILGHTGRNVSEPPRILKLVFLLLIVTVLFRVMLPLIDASHYLLWIGLSQFFWISAFIIFSVTYIPQLIRPRIDGKPG